jgi:hypothetical protein
VPIIPLATRDPRRGELLLKKLQGVLCGQRGSIAAIVFVIAALGWIPGIAAQELAPRSFWPAPKGTKVVVIGYSYSSGDVLMDPSLPIYGADSKISTGFLGYQQTFGLWGRTTNILLEIPYSWGTTKGFLFDTPARREFSGFNDLGITLAVNLLGAPSLTPQDLVELRANPRPLLGASIKVLFPIGRYEKNKLINVGANRWAFKPKLGTMIPLAPKWLLELDASAWFFFDDTDFIVGKREQHPIFAAEVHLVRRLKAGFWASLDANYFRGGRQTIGGNPLVDVQHNSRLGGTVVVPFGGRHAIKVGFSTGVLTKFGTDFEQFLASYMLIFR